MSTPYKLSAEQREANRIFSRNYRRIARKSKLHKNLKAILDHFNPDPETGTISRRTWKTNSGYEFAPWMGKTYYVHRLIWMAANNRFIPDGFEINHKDLNKSNNKISNLELMTRKQNIQHANANGHKTGRTRVLSDGERKERARQAVKKYYWANREKIIKHQREYQREYFLKNIEKIREQNKLQRRAARARQRMERDEKEVK